HTCSPPTMLYSLSLHDALPISWLMGSWNCGVFTHREIAQRLMDTFTGLKIKELAWFENPREKTLKNGKPRARRAKWLPEREVDLDRKSTRLNSSHVSLSYAVFC